MFGLKRAPIDEADYVAVHGVRPRGHGVWVLRDQRTRSLITLKGRFAAVRLALRDGSWWVSPASTRFRPAVGSRLVTDLRLVGRVLAANPAAVVVVGVAVVSVVVILAS